MRNSTMESKKKLRWFSIIFFASTFIALWLEMVPRFRRRSYALLPIAIILIIYNLVNMFGGWDRFRRVLVSFRGTCTCIIILIGMAACCIPINEIDHYLPPDRQPFQNYRWLLVSCYGILASFSLLNSLLLIDNQKLSGLIKRCSALWRLRQPYFLGLCVLWMFLITNLFSFTVFEHIPHIQDEIAQLFQAKIFLQGSLTAPLPPIPEFFSYHYDNIILKDRWYSQYPPGHPALLALGLFLGAPWIVNPLFAALSIIVLYKSAVLLYGEREARLSSLLFCISPFVLFMSSSYMNHVTTLFFIMLCGYSLLRVFLKGNVLWSMCAGFSLGMIGNIRPGDGFVFSIYYGMIFFVFSCSRRMFKPFIYFGAAAVVMFGVLLWYNYATNGNPFLFGFNVRWGPQHTLGFTKTPPIDRPVFTWGRAIVHALSNSISLNQNLFEWPLPSLLPSIIFFAPYLFKKTLKEYLLLCGLIAAPIFYFFFFFQDLCLGPRFYYPTVPFIVILTARFVFQIITKIIHNYSYHAQRVKQAFVMLFIFYVCFAGFLRMPKLYRFYSNGYWEIDNKLMKKVEALGIKNALIFQKAYGIKGNSLGAGFLHNSPSLNDSVVFARDLGERNKELAAFFPGRSYYLASRDEKDDVVIEQISFDKQ